MHVPVELGGVLSNHKLVFFFPLFIDTPDCRPTFMPVFHNEYISSLSAKFILQPTHFNFRSELNRHTAGLYQAIRFVPSVTPT